MDFIIRNAKLRDAKELTDIAIDSGKIVAIKGKVNEKANGEFDAAGRLVLPSFSDMHFHLDSVFTMGKPRYNESGTLLEGTTVWSEYRQSFNKDVMKQNVTKALEMMVSQGTTRIRTHADVNEASLNTVKGLLEIKKECADIIDIQVTALNYDGMLTDPNNYELLEKAVEMGCDNVGLIPHVEYTREEGVKSVDLAFKLAKKYNRWIDGHVDETDDDQSRFLEVVASQTLREGYQGKVAAGHVTAMGSYFDQYAFKLYNLLKKANVTIVANPLINIHLQGRFDTYPKRRGMTRIKELCQNGINVCLGHDCWMDPWYPLGNGDMLQSLFMGIHVGQLTSMKELHESLDLITVNPAKGLGIEKNYGVEVGKTADLVVTDAFDELELIRTMYPRLLVMKAGKVVSESTPHSRIIVRNNKKKTLNYHL